MLGLFGAAGTAVVLGGCSPSNPKAIPRGSGGGGGTVDTSVLNVGVGSLGAQDWHPWLSSHGEEVVTALSATS